MRRSYETELGILEVDSEKELTSEEVTKMCDGLMADAEGKITQSKIKANSKVK